jgi:uncharacterized spore protein YtfJ
VSPKRARGPQALKTVRRFAGVRLSFGSAVRAGDRAVVPVARVFVLGGFGVGTGENGEAKKKPTPQEGGGGGGMVLSRPLGFIDVTPDGARYETLRKRSPVPGLIAAAAAGAVAGAALTGGAAAGAAAAVSVARRVSRVRRLLPGGRRSSRRSLRR